jgi:hypothetical protein
MQLKPPTFPAGAVDGTALSKAFSIFYREVLSRMDLRYHNNDFGGIGNTGQVLTSTGVADPTWQETGFPSIPNNTIVGNVSGGTSPAVAITEAQLTALINLATALVSGAVPPLPADATKFFNGNGSYTVPAYPTAANPTAKVGTTTVNGSAATFMRSDAAPALDTAASYTFTGNQTFTPVSGDAVTLNTFAGANAAVIAGTSAGTAVIRANAQATTGAKTASFTATNKPGANNQTTPAIWLPINCDGTVYYFPGFAA